jgi:hypothetical protein
VGGVVIATGCDGKCSGSYDCPYDGLVDQLSTANLPSALVEVSADSPCAATLLAAAGAGDGDGGAVVSVLVSSDVVKPLTCHVYGSLADGETVAATISFQAETSGCCPGFISSSAGFNLTDAGTDRS